jgi:hypothetical protein
MTSLQNSVSLILNTFISLNSRGKSQNHTKPQNLITSTLMEEDHRTIGTTLTWHPRIKHKKGPSTRDSTNTAKGVDQWAGAAVTVEARTQSNLHIVCTIVMRPTIAPKIAPSSWTRRRKRIKIPYKPLNNPHPEKSTTPCNGTPIINNTPSYPSLFPLQVYQTSQAPPPAY